MVGGHTDKRRRRKVAGADGADFFLLCEIGTPWRAAKAPAPIAGPRPAAGAAD
jgi:hypothetical protein